MIDELVGVADPKLPDPVSIFVAAPEDIEPLLRDARAELARLRLELRAAEAGADVAERHDAGDEASKVATLQATLSDRAMTSQRERDRALERVRGEASAHVDAARREAAAIIAAAETELFSYLRPTHSIDLIDLTAPTVQYPPTHAAAADRHDPPARERTIDSGSALRRFLHIDVVLPLIAALIVIIVALAWAS